MLNGIIIVNKEAGYTSHDVVAKLRGICGQRKIGHTGTLDPDAVGVLPVCLGSGTKLCDLLTDRTKEYVALLQLGVVTDTQDMTGTVLDRKPVLCNEEQIREAVSGFLGDYLQVPPMYSALKVGGKKLYELARAGREVERAARPVTIHELEVLECGASSVKLRVVCSKGTYIRTLCHDIGGKLGCGGAMAYLERTRVGEFSIDNAYTLARLQVLRDEGRLGEALLAVDSVFRNLPALQVKEEFFGLVENGNALNPEQAELSLPEGSAGVDRVRVYGREGMFYGVYAWASDRGVYKPVKMFPPEK